MPRHRQPRERSPSEWPLHALGRDVIRDLERDYRVHGARTISDLRKNQPSSYLRLLRFVTPEQAPGGEDWLSQFSNEELDMLMQLVRDALAEKRNMNKLDDPGA